LAWKGVKRWCQKSLVTLIAEMHTSFDLLNSQCLKYGGITAQMGSDKLNVGSDKTHVGQ